MPPNPPMRSSPETNSNSCFVLRAIELGLRRSRLRQPRDLLGDDPLDLGQRRAGPRRRLHDERAGDLGAECGTRSRPCTAACRRRAPCSAATTVRRSGSATPGPAPHRRARSTRARATPCRCAPAGRDRRLRRCVRALSVGHPAGRPIERGAGRDGAEVLLDERLGLRGIEVAGDDERQVVGRVVAPEELLHVVQRRGASGLPCCRSPATSTGGPWGRADRRGCRTSGRTAGSRGPAAARS